MVGYPGRGVGGGIAGIADIAGVIAEIGMHTH
jgi:hypothetical protein